MVTISTKFYRMELHTICLPLSPKVISHCIGKYLHAIEI